MKKFEDGSDILEYIDNNGQIIRVDTIQDDLGGGGGGYSEPVIVPNDNLPFQDVPLPVIDDIQHPVVPSVGGETSPIIDNKKNSDMLISNNTNTVGVIPPAYDTMLNSELALETLPTNTLADTTTTVVNKKVFIWLGVIIACAVIAYNLLTDKKNNNKKYY